MPGSTSNIISKKSKHITRNNNRPPKMQMWRNFNFLYATSVPLAVIYSPEYREQASRGD